VQPFLFNLFADPVRTMLYNLRTPSVQPPT
jgi:hypothetical protein